MKIETKEYSFALKDPSENIFNIACEPMEQNLQILNNGTLFLDLKKGISHEKAKEVVQFLQNHIKSISYGHKA